MERNQTAQKAILVGIAAKAGDLLAVEKSLDELERLLETAGGSAFARLVQVRDAMDVRTGIGSGKVDELRALASANEIGLAVFDFELSPSQIRNLEDALDGVSVIDRSMLILDIFALHAVSGEGKIQVELAQLKYTAPRLIGKGGSLSRLAGGIGSRGPGESQLELDRRHLKRRIDALEAQIAEMEKNRATMRAARIKSGIPTAAIVGYTNAGKSTLLNRLTNAGVLSEDKLFATLDPTTRRLALPSEEEILLTDTVGFIRKLPHHLIKSFHSTLEAAAQSDILILVADASDPECGEQIAVTRDLLEELGAADKPTLLVYNKCDAVDGELPSAQGQTVYMSAKDGSGLDAFFAALEQTLAAGKRRRELLFPYSDQGRISGLYDVARVESVEYADEGIRVVATMDAKAEGLYRKYIV
ncbi:MAG: GTPase HflX [Clostridia bacterium]|nr:GTPase HflX [Clostridia bacterium]